MKDQEPVQAVIKILSLLESLAHEEEIGVTKLSKKVGSNKSTVYRFLNTLKNLGYVRQNPENEKYSLTLRLFEIGSVVLDRLDEKKIAIPVMKKLAEQTMETVHFAILDEGKLVYLHKIDSTQTLRVSMMSRIGQNAPLHCTGVGKTLLSWLEPEEANALLRQNEIHNFTNNTITDPIKLAAEFQKIRDIGYAEDNEEHEEGVRCLAAPIRDRHGDVTAAISLSGPRVRIIDSRIEALKDLILSAAGEISSYLGYSPIP